jgi:hypothetical protein
MSQAHAKGAFSSVRPGRKRGELRAIATGQKIVLFCILFVLLSAFAKAGLKGKYPPTLDLVTLGVALVYFTAFFMLAMKLYGTGRAVLFTLWAVIPLLGLVALYIVNRMATKTLRAYGLKVGALGADVSKVDRLPRADEEEDVQIDD